MAANDLFDLTGTVALVTGGNRGIGRGIALGLAAAGADVVIAARDEGASGAVAAEVEALGRRALGVRCDVLERADIDAAVEAARATFGRLDVLVSNAGVAGGGRPETMDMAEWHRVLGTNLTAVVECAQSAYPLLRAGGRGKVINIGSMYSLFGSPTGAPYAASKGGVIQLTKSLAVAWAGDGIQVNAILPGWFPTDMTQPAIDNERTYRRIVDRTPAGRFGESDELAGAAVFLASHASDFVTGQSIVVDGGYSIA